MELSPPAVVFSSTSSSPPIFSVAALAAELEAVAAGIDYENGASVLRVAAEEENARLRNVAYLLLVLRQVFNQRT